MKALRDVMPGYLPPAGAPPAYVPPVGLPPAGLSFGGSAARALDLRELRYFQSVGRTGNFGRAARELNISQPTVTSQVLKLEEGLGTRLLIRHGRGVTLTPAGACLMDRIDAIMGLLNAPLEQAAAPDRTLGTIALALPPEAAPLLAPRLLEACRARWPDVTLAVREGNSASLEEWVLDGRADIALLQDPPVLDGLEIEPVVTERLGIVTDVRARWPEGPVGVRHLMGRTLILPHPRHWIRRLVEAAAFRRGVALDRIQESGGVSLTKEMVRNGLGCTVLPYAAVQDEAARGALAFYPIARDPLFTVHAIAGRSGAGSAPFVSGVRDVFRDVLRDLAASGVWAGAAAVVAKAGGSGASAIMEAAVTEAANTPSAMTEAAIMEAAIG